jgi:hypothetical protein
MPTPDLLPTMAAYATCIASHIALCPYPRDLPGPRTVSQPIYIPFPLTMIICLLVGAVTLIGPLIVANLTAAVDNMLLLQEVNPDELTRKIGRLSQLGRGLIGLAIRWQSDPAQHSQLVRLATLLKSSLKDN